MLTPEYINNLSNDLKIAVIKTLDLDPSEEIFIGNEEKLFLLNVIDKTTQHQLIDGSGVLTAKTLGVDITIQDSNSYTLNRMYDIFENENKIKNKQSLIRSFVNLSRYWLLLIKSLVLLIKIPVIIHSHGYFKHKWFVIEELSKAFIKYDKKDNKLRARFKNELLKRNLDRQIILEIVNLFPISHLESYTKIKNHWLTKLKINTVVSCLHGIMADPLLGSIIRKNKSDIFYLQHGGGYGLRMNRIQYMIEEDGCKKMFFWGTGNHNIFPSRYKSVFFPKIGSDVAIVLSSNKNIDTDGRNAFISIAKSLQNKTEVKPALIAYPGSCKSIFDYSNTQLGISYRNHLKARLVIYDSVGQSLLFARILSKRPFLIVDDFPLEIDKNNKNAQRFIFLLREAKLLINRTDVIEQTMFWLSLDVEEMQNKFNEIASEFFDHVLSQPTINEIFFTKPSRNLDN